MKSKLNKTEFKRRLTELTSEKKDFYLITPFNSSATPFCGTFDDSTFDLERNSFWRQVTAIEIKGEYKDSDNNSTEVIYEVGPSEFTRNLVVLLMGLTFIVLNVFIFAIRDKVESSMFLVQNGLLAFGCLWGLTITWVTKKIVNQRFKEEFEIEDDWE